MMILFSLIAYGIPPQALLLSHPFPSTRDTQQLAYKYKLSKGRHPALRNLTAQEFGIQIHGGEHSSVCLIFYFRCAAACVFTFFVQVTDARATMAIYRLHRREWEKGKNLTLPSYEGSDCADPSRTLKKRKRPGGEEGNGPLTGGKKGMSSGFSTVVKSMNPSKTGNTSSLVSKKKTEWWSELGSSKGSLRIS